MDYIRDWLRENRITEVECLVPDMTGNARGKFIPADKFIKEDSRLPESILVQTVTGDYRIASTGHAQCAQAGSRVVRG
jgi:glutamine synthetase